MPTPSDMPYRLRGLMCLGLRQLGISDPQCTSCPFRNLDELKVDLRNRFIQEADGYLIQNMSLQKEINNTLHSPKLSLNSPSSTLSTTTVLGVLVGGRSPAMNPF